METPSRLRVSIPSCFPLPSIIFVALLLHYCAQLKMDPEISIFVRFNRSQQSILSGIPPTPESWHHGAESRNLLIKNNELFPLRPAMNIYDIPVSLYGRPSVASALQRRVGAPVTASDSESDFAPSPHYHGPRS